MRSPVAKCSLTAFVEREGDGFVSLCPELDIASQGKTVEEAAANLREAVELYLECADAQEIKSRLKGEVYISRFEAVYA
jgi:predicted RNase H-like HicB family nuclease